MRMNDTVGAHLSAACDKWASIDGWPGRKQEREKERKTRTTTTPTSLTDRKKQIGW